MLVHAGGPCHAEGWRENDTAEKTHKGFQDRHSHQWTFSEANRGKIQSAVEGLAAEPDHVFLKHRREACGTKLVAQKGTKLHRERNWS